MKRVLLKNLPIAFFLSFLLFIAIEAPLYEDDIYFYFLKSFIQDFDINILNQIPADFRGFVTKRLYFPTHHSLIQTPVLLLFYGVESLLASFLEFSGFREGVLTGFVTHIFCIFLGIKFSIDYIEEIGKKIDCLAIFLIFFTTSILYYSFFTVMVIEIFTFPLASYVLLNVARLKNSKDISFLSFGLSLGLLISSKFYFFGLLTYVLVEILLKFKEVGKNRLIYFLTAILFPVLVSLWIHYQQYGEFFFWAGEISKSMSSFTFLNLKETLIHGLWGSGGLFVVNPIYFFLCTSVLLYSYRLMRKRETFIVGGFYLAWLVQGFFTTVFIAGAIISDQYIGRLVMNTLPLLILGTVLLLEKLRFLPRFILWCGAVALFVLQMFRTLNYAFLIKKDHYLYGLQRFMEWEDFADNVYRVLYFGFLTLKESYLLFLLVVILTTLAIQFLSNKGNVLRKGFGNILLYNSVFFLLIAILNFLYIDQNNEDYFKSNDFQKVTVGKTPRVYSFIYVTDGLKSQYLGTSSIELRKINRQKLRDYYREIEGDFIQITPEFKKMMKDNLKGIEETKYYLDQHGR